MSLSAMKFSRARVLALLLVAIFSIGAVGVTVLASDASASAKKKKCKKGYKQAAKGKCKKVKKVKSKAFVAALSTVSASSDATAAKKKKCKKGYKRTNGKGKCKKKKATSKTVSSVNLQINDKSIYEFKFSGEVITKTPLTTISVTVNAAHGPKKLSKVVTATGDGTSTTLTFSGDIKNPLLVAGPRVNPRIPVTIVAVADGISSKTINQ